MVGLLLYKLYANIPVENVTERERGKHFSKQFQKNIKKTGSISLVLSPQLNTFS